MEQINAVAIPNKSVSLEQVPRIRTFIRYQYIQMNSRNALSMGTEDNTAHMIE